MDHSQPVDVGEDSTLSGDTAPFQGMVSIIGSPRDEITTVNRPNETLSELQQEHQEDPEIETQPEPQSELQPEIKTEPLADAMQVTPCEAQTQPEPQSTQPNTPTQAKSQVQSDVQPKVPSDFNDEPDQTGNDEVLTVSKSPDPEENKSVGEASGKSTQSKKRTRTTRTPAPFEQRDVNLPPEDACDLTNEQITTLIHQTPSVRKKYEAYFGRNGCIRTKYHALVLAKSANGDYIIPESIIRSNVHHWKGPLDPLKPSTPHGTGRKQATKDASAKRSASNELDEDPPPKKRTKAENTTTKPKSDRPGKAKKSVQRSDTNIDDRPAMANKSAQASDTDFNANAAALMGNLLDSEASDWFREHDESDLELLNSTELLLLMLWLNSELRALQYSLAGALHLDDLDKGQHKEMLEAILRALHQLICVCNELARHLQAEVAMKK